MSWKNNFVKQSLSFKSKNKKLVFLLLTFLSGLRNSCRNKLFRSHSYSRSIVIKSHVKGSNRAGKYVLMLLLILTISWIPLCIGFISDLSAHIFSEEMENSFESIDCFSTIPYGYEDKILRYLNTKTLQSSFLSTLWRK